MLLHVQRQRGLRIPAGGRFDEGFQVLDQGGVRLVQEGPAGAGMAAAFGREVVGRHVFGVAEFAQAGPDGRPGQAGGLGDQGDAAALEGHGFASGPMAAHPFVHQRAQQFKLAPHGFKGGVSVHTITNAAITMPIRSSNYCPVPPHRHVDPVLLADQIAHGLSGPQGRGDVQIPGAVVVDLSLEVAGLIL